MTRPGLRVTVGLVMLILMALSAAYSFDLLGLRGQFPPPAVARSEPAVKR